MGDLEMLILNCIWDNANSTVKQVHNMLTEDGRQIARTTVLTIIQRLEKKKYLIRDKSSSVTTYKAIEKRESVLKSLSKKFLKNMLSGSLKPAVQSFLEQNPSKEELKEIESMLKKFKEGQK